MLFMNTNNNTDKELPGLLADEYYTLSLEDFQCEKDPSTWWFIPAPNLKRRR
jgi:hypothetical protein